MPVSSEAHPEGIHLICVMMAVLSIVSIECCVFCTTLLLATVVLLLYYVN